MDTLITQGVPSFGVFEQLSNYGALGLVVLALGAVAWMFLKRHLDENDRLRKQLEDRNK